MATSTRPRYLAGISSSIAELIAAYHRRCRLRSGSARRSTASRRERGQHGGDRVDAQGQHEKFLAPEPVGQMTEEQGTDTGAGHVDRAGKSDDPHSSGPSRYPEV